MLSYGPKKFAARCGFKGFFGELLHVSNHFVPRAAVYHMASTAWYVCSGARSRFCCVAYAACHIFCLQEAPASSLAILKSHCCAYPAYGPKYSAILSCAALYRLSVICSSGDGGDDDDDADDTA